MATELRKLKLRRVALVDQGANAQAFVTLYKRDENAQEVGTMPKDETAVVEETQTVATVAKADYDALLEKSARAESDLQAARQEAETAHAELAKRDEQIEIAKYEAEAQTVPHLGTQGAGWLRSIAKVLGDQYPSFRERLVALETQVREGELLKERGSNATGEDASPAGVADAIAKRLRVEDPTLTIEQAKARAYDTPEYAAARRAAEGK